MNEIYWHKATDNYLSRSNDCAAFNGIVFVFVFVFMFVFALVFCVDFNVKLLDNCFDTFSILSVCWLLVSRVWFFSHICLCIWIISVTVGPVSSSFKRFKRASYVLSTNFCCELFPSIFASRLKEQTNERMNQWTGQKIYFE